MKLLLVSWWLYKFDQWKSFKCYWTQQQFGYICNQPMSYYNCLWLLLLLLLLLLSLL